MCTAKSLTFIRFDCFPTRNILRYAICTYIYTKRSYMFKNPVSSFLNGIRHNKKISKLYKYLDQATRTLERNNFFMVFKCFMSVQVQVYIFEFFPFHPTSVLLAITTERYKKINTAKKISIRHQRQLNFLQKRYRQLCRYL